MYRARLLMSLACLAVLLVSILPGSLGAQEVTPSSESSVGPVVVRLYFGTRDDLNAIAAEHDVWEVHHDQGYAVIMLYPAEYQDLLARGYRMEVDEEKTRRVNNPEAIPGYPCYRTVEETYADMQTLVSTYPNLVEMFDIGDSWDKLTPGGPAGYDIYALRITNENIPGPKPIFFLMAEIHSREYTTAETAMRFAEYLLDNYSSDPEFTLFVDYHEIHIVPMTNPDGRKFAEQGQLWRKNTNNNQCATGSYGVDLNRNHSFKWGCCGGSSPDPCDPTYRGVSPASEPETQSIQNYVLTLFPDQRGPGDNDPAPIDATGLFITLHSYSELVLWPWGWTYTNAPNAAQLQTIGTKLATYNDYTPEQSSDLYITDGTSDDWCYGELGVASFTFEMGTTFFQSCSAFENTIWPDNRDSLFYAYKIPETPYMTAYGPDSLDAAAIPSAAQQGTPIQLTATINDSQNGNQNVTAAEYFVLSLHGTTPPGDPGTGTAMQPADGSWNSPVEDVEATVDTSGLTPGDYLIALRGKDAGDNWGPLTAVFLYIVEPGVSPVIEGYVRDAGDNAPLDATVTAGSFQANTDPTTGYYNMTVVSGTYDMSAVAAGHAISTVTGIEAHNYETIQQDFYLSPICEIFSDDVESGNQGWTAEGQWAITTEASHSPSHSWTDSPGASYGNNWNYSLISPIFDLTDYTAITLGFWHIYDLEDDYDYGYVEVSTNGGGSWTEVASYNGEDQTTWVQETLTLTDLDDQANARLRFRLDTDGSVRADGWHIDDILITGGGPGCVTPMTPVAEFTSNSPVTLGEPMIFTNLTTGTVPILYEWEFGDGFTSTLEHPTHTYPMIDTYTVTLRATNPFGSDSVSHPVVVLPGVCVDLTSITIDGATGGQPEVYTFTTSYTPPAATPPIDYLWDNGDTTSYSIRNLGVGTHTLIVTGTNCTDTVVVDTHTIVITQTPACTEVTGVDLTLVTTGTIYPGDEVEFAADLADDAESPYSYLVTVDGVPGPTQTASVEPIVFTHTFGLTGTHEVEIAVWNCDMAPGDAVTDVISVIVYEPGTCVDLTSITIDGATGGQPEVYTFTTSYTPPGATPPIDYLWDNGDMTSYSIRSLGVGTHTLIVTGTNCTDTVVVDTHTIVITPTPACTEVTGVDLTLVTTGTIYPGDEVEFAADLADDAESPYSYLVTVDGIPGPTRMASVEPIVFTHTFGLTGTHEVEVAVWNCDMAPGDAVTDVITVIVYEPGTCVDLVSIDIAGPTSGAPAVYTFTTSYQPPGASLPITYTWDNGDTASYSVRSLGVGTYTLTVTATNCSTAQVTDMHIIVVSEPVTYSYIYLPLLMKNSN